MIEGTQQGALVQNGSKQHPLQTSSHLTLTDRNQPLQERVSHSRAQAYPAMLSGVFLLIWEAGTRQAQALSWPLPDPEPPRHGQSVHSHCTHGMFRCSHWHCMGTHQSTIPYCEGVMHSCKCNCGGGLLALATLVSGFCAGATERSRKGDPACDLWELKLPSSTCQHRARAHCAWLNVTDCDRPRAREETSETGRNNKAATCGDFDLLRRTCHHMHRKDMQAHYTVLCSHALYCNALLRKALHCVVLQNIPLQYT